jgi:two-component system cell cycle response regulator DivK
MSHKDETSSAILIADDFADFRLMMKVWLESRGYRVLEAEDGDQAVASTQLKRPDLILMDIGMPNRSGISATYRIRKQPELRNIPIVAITAYESPELQADALKAGCVECLTKPISGDQLSDLLRRLLPIKQQ